MTALWASQDIAQAVNGGCSGRWEVTRISIDSRTIETGDLFVALKGPSFDGHDFVKDALDKGAAGAIVSQVPEGTEKNKLIIVDNTMTAMEDLGSDGRKRFKGKAIAITGSVGKTSTKEMLALVLAEFGTVHASVKSFNNHWGVPLTLANLPPDTDYAVLELGMNHAGEISALTNLARPDIAIITAIAAVHLENFQSVADIAAAKAEIFEGLTSGGTAITPRDSEHHEILKSGAEHHAAHVLSFGHNAKADARIDNLIATADGTRSIIHLNDQEIRLDLSLPGRHFAENAAAVLLTINTLGLNVEKAAAKLGQFTAVEGRGTRETLSLPDGGSFTLIDESYNANPLAMRAAFEVLSILPGRRHIVVLGDMLELGDDAPALHAALLDDIRASKIDMVFTCGPLMQNLHDAIIREDATVAEHHAENSIELATIVCQAVRDGDILLVKGSNGSKMKEVVTALKSMMPEQKDACNVL